MPMTTKVESERDQLVSMLKQLVDEREILSRENEYLKAKLNESMLLETITELKKERDILLKLLSNLTINKSQNPIHLLSSPSHSTLIKPNATLSRHNRVHRSKTNNEPPSTIAYSKHSQTNKKILVYQTSTTPPTQEFNKSIRKHDIQLKHSQNSPFQHYRSQSLQDLT